MKQAENREWLNDSGPQGGAGSVFAKVPGECRQLFRREAAALLPEMRLYPGRYGVVMRPQMEGSIGRLTFSRREGVTLLQAKSSRSEGCGGFVLG